MPTFFHHKQHNSFYNGHLWPRVFWRLHMLQQCGFSQRTAKIEMAALLAECLVWAPEVYFCRPRMMSKQASTKRLSSRTLFTAQREIEWVSVCWRQGNWMPLNTCWIVDTSDHEHHGLRTGLYCDSVWQWFQCWSGVKSVLQKPFCFCFLTHH